MMAITKALSATVQASTPMQSSVRQACTKPVLLTAPGVGLSPTI